MNFVLEGQKSDIPYCLVLGNRHRQINFSLITNKNGIGG